MNPKWVAVLTLAGVGLLGTIDEKVAYIAAEDPLPLRRAIRRRAESSPVTYLRVRELAKVWASQSGRSVLEEVADDARWHWHWAMGRR